MVVEPAYGCGSPLLPYVPWRLPFWGGSMPTMFGRMAALQGTWDPRMDVYEQDNAVVVEAELPGLKKGDVQIALDDGSLVIRGENKAETEMSDDGYYRNERSFGGFYRRVPLPFDV
jgi:HSP20 family molecular chaperone IbpA